MAVNGPDLISGTRLTFGTPLRVKLDPGATYHAVLTTSSGADVGCKGALNTLTDSSSLAGFSFIDRVHGYPASAQFSDQPCRALINGFELVSSTFVQSVEFTSSPALAGMYAAGEVIEATATLSEAVTFVGPPPALPLQIGDNEREMTYAALSSTTTSWVFRYRVTADDRDDDGVSFERNALQGYADADLSNRPTRDDQGAYCQRGAAGGGAAGVVESAGAALVRAGRADPVHGGVLATGDGGRRSRAGVQRDDALRQ